MQKTLAAIIMLTTSVLAASAQRNLGVTAQGDVAATYQWVHTNAQPGDCGCFGLSGGGISASWRLRPDIGLVADLSSETSRAAGQASSSLTLTSYLGGVRYYLPAFELDARHAFQPFAEILLGGAHAGGSGAGIADRTNAFAARIGGGLDVPVSQFLVLRVAQIDYFPTTFDNTKNHRQNNLLVGGGIAFRWPTSR